MILERLILNEVRNYESLDWTPSAGLNALVGDNAQGKSNLLESICMLGTGKSFRTAQAAQIVRNGAAVATIAGVTQPSGSTAAIRLACRVALGANGARKSFSVNGHPARYGGYLGRMRVVSFVPNDLQLVTGAPTLRRAFLNAALAQDSAPYYAALAAYGRALGQKAALLRAGGALDDALLSIYDERLIETGTVLMLARRSFCSELAERAQVAYRAFSGMADGPLGIVYVPNVAFDVPTADGVQSAFRAQLRKLRSAEIARGAALCGPHRDDVAFMLDARSLDAYGSQGQQRTAVLAAKVAEFRFLEARSAEAPILLLDDVLSELDDRRRAGFLDAVGTYGQAFVTSAGEIEAAGAALYRVRSATIERIG